MTHFYRFCVLNLLFLCTAPLVGFAQKHAGSTPSVFPKGVFVILNNGKIIQGDTVILPEGYRSRTLTLDDSSYSMEQIRLFRSRYHPQYPSMYTSGVVKGRRYSYPISLKRMGKLNSFSRGLSASYGISSASGTALPTVSFSENLYYNRGTGPLKFLSYKNLKKDIRDNPRSMAILRQTRSLQVFGGGVMLGAGAFTLYVLSRGKELDNLGALVLGGLGAGGLGLLCVYISPSRISAAFRHYNKNK